MELRRWILFGGLGRHLLLQNHSGRHSPRLLELSARILRLVVRVSRHFVVKGEEFKFGDYGYKQQGG